MDFSSVAPTRPRTGRGRSSPSSSATGPCPEETAARVTRNMCDTLRTHECATWLARWRFDHPASAAARAYDPRTIERMGLLDGLEPAALARIERLFAGELPALGPASDPLRWATRFATLFSTAYVHAIPFDRALLRGAWDRCDGAGPAGEACRAARARTDERLDRF